MVAFVSSLPTFFRRLPEQAFVFSTQKEALWFGLNFVGEFFDGPIAAGFLVRIHRTVP